MKVCGVLPIRSDRLRFQGSSQDETALHLNRERQRAASSNLQVASQKAFILWKHRVAIAVRPALKKTLQGALEGLQYAAFGMPESQPPEPLM